MIDVRPVDLSPEGLERSAAMIRAAMPRAAHIDADVLRWQYVDNPAGPALGLEAFEGDRLVSHCVVQPLEARLHGRDVRGVMSMNAATLPDQVGRGIYFGLARDLYESLRDAAEYAFGIAVTNDRSTPGFVHHCGFRELGVLEARVGAAAAPATRGGPAPDLEKRWSPESLAWRLAPPHRRYRFVPRGDETRVFAGTDLPGVHVELGRIAPAAAPKQPDAPPWPRVNLWLGVDPALDWSRSAAWNLPMRLRPAPLRLIFAPLAGDAETPALDRVRWHALDFDDF